MRFFIESLDRQYGSWINRWENNLCFRATDRVTRPFDVGLQWASGWPGASAAKTDSIDEITEAIRLNECAVADSERFFDYIKPQDFELRGEWLHFTSPVSTNIVENNRVAARWFRATSNSRKAVVVLPHWNSKLPQHNALCAGLQRLGISVLRLSLPYHDSRMPGHLARADYAVSANICRTIDATRQAVIDTRACFDWLESQGFKDLGIVGTSLGSCYAFLASAHDERIGVNVFNHCSTYFADVVWEGLSTRHIRESLQSELDLETLRRLWLCISPPSYWGLYTKRKKRSKFIYTRYDTTFPVHLSENVIAGARAHKWDHSVAVLPCGHYTMGEFPFKYLTGFEICAFLKRNL